jgi:PIN domain nuclease of toxin-antitoxin system
VTLLLDTHAFLWWRLNDPRIESIRRPVATAQSVLVSSASAWEAAIKQRLGKLRLEAPFERMVSASGFTGLVVTFSHAERLLTLPSHHRDPFDRMLIAQALVEGATIVTNDPQFERYDVSVLRV